MPSNETFIIGITRKINELEKKTAALQTSAKTYQKIRLALVTSVNDDNTCEVIVFSPSGEIERSYPRCLPFSLNIPSQGSYCLAVWWLLEHQNDVESIPPVIIPVGSSTFVFNHGHTSIHDGGCVGFLA